jgi:outer membrane beta-barrel protein
MKLKHLLLPACLAAMSWLTPGEARAEDETPPGLQALDEFRNGRNMRNPVLNRFFLKGKRFELSPQFGIVPNNPFARRITVGLGLGYHFNEQLSVQGLFSFAPDLGTRDVKPLTAELLRLASDDSFEQPLDKVSLSAAFGVQYAPFYGKINVLGETVASFDFYGFLGLGFVLQQEYYATENPNFTGTIDPADPSTRSAVNLTKGDLQIRPAPVVGVGGNFFLTSAVALKLDGRFTLYVDDKPVYDRDNPPEGLRVVPLFNANVGVSVFVPRMKPRLYDF